MVSTQRGNFVFENVNKNNPAIPGYEKRGMREEKTIYPILFNKQTNTNLAFLKEFYH